MTQVMEPVDASPPALTALDEARRVFPRPAGAAVTPQKIAAWHRAGGSVEALRRVPLAARARIESETDGLLMLLARARRRDGSDDETQAAIALIEDLIARIQAELIAARM